MTAPKISIITPSFNQVDYIEKAIASVLRQNYANKEHIIIDGGSTDGTLTILKKYDGIRWLSEKDNGQSHAFNKGFALTDGEIIGWLNSDDLYDKDVFAMVAEAFANNPDVIAVYGGCTIIDKHDHIVAEIPVPDCTFKSMLHKGYSVIAQPSVFIKRKYLAEERVVLDETLNYSMDYDLFLRLLRKGPFLRINKNISFFRMHDTSKTQVSAVKMREESYLVSKKYGGHAIVLDIKLLIDKVRHTPQGRWIMKNLKYCFNKMRTSG